jgi:bla regulator protein blaR1
MIAWMIYIMSVTLVLGAAALSAERIARLRRRDSRWTWTAAVALSLAMPVVVESISVRLPASFAPADVAPVATLRNLTMEGLAPLRTLGARATQGALDGSWDAFIRSAWIATSLGMALALALGSLQIARRKRRWAGAVIDGTTVHVAPDVGPAVVGLIRPCIVVPSWLTTAPLSQQAAVMAHERSHCDARDPQLLAVALWVLVAMPWNLPLWWITRRLRRAIEIDCDARVLRDGHDARLYGETLLTVGGRQSGFIPVVAAMSEPRSFLEQRIRIMLTKPVSAWRLSAVFLATLSVGLVAVASQIDPPRDAAGPTGDAPLFEISEQVLDRYTGHYRYADNAIVTVIRDGRQLIARFPSRPADPIDPQSATLFSFRNVDARLSFEVDQQGRTVAATLHQNGAETRMQRVSATHAGEVASALAERVQKQIASPGSDAALRRLIDGIASGKPDYDAMNQQLAAALRQDAGRLRTGLAALGKIRSIELLRVEAGGLDVYAVHHEHGTSQWSIGLDSSGTIVGVMIPF